ncbi:MAG: hypothetical protein U1F57_04770 [bacterium]
MAHSQALIQFRLRQNRLIETLDHLSQSIDKFYEQMAASGSPRLEKVQKQLLKFEERLNQEIEHFSSLIENSALGQLEVRAHLEKVSAQVEALAQNLFHKYREFSFEEWKSSLPNLSQEVAQVRDELRNIDMKGALSHVADSVLLDSFDNLGEHEAIQWPRKIWHALASLGIVWVYLFSRGTMTAKMTVFGCFTFYATICDSLRMISPRFNTLVMRDLKKFMRKREATRLNSMTFYALSTFFVCLLYPKGPAILSILFLGLGDTAASLVGIKWGRHKIFGRRYSMEGSLAFFATCFLLTFLYPLLVPAFSGNIWVLAFFGGLIGMTSEWASYRLDDNLVIPLYSATLLTLATKIF